MVVRFFKRGEEELSRVAVAGLFLLGSDGFEDDLASPLLRCWVLADRSDEAKRVGRFRTARGGGATESLDSGGVSSSASSRKCFGQLLSHSGQVILDLRDDAIQPVFRFTGVSNEGVGDVLDKLTVALVR
jgi:hypothetical protein